MAGEGAAPEIGPAVGAEVSVEGGGLGAAASSLGKVEAGAMVSTPELGGIGDLKPQAEGLAKELEATLGTPDIGINKIAEVSVPDIALATIGTPKDKLPGIDTPESADQPTAVNSGGENGIGPAATSEAPEGNEPTGELTPQAETEAQTPTEESPKVPGKLASDTEYIRIVGEHYSELKQQGVPITKEQINQVTKQSLSEHYDNLAKTQVEKGLPEEVRKDPLYQQELGKAMQAAQEKGEPLDANKLSQEALSRYQQEKDLQAEVAAGPRAERLSTTEERLIDHEERMSALEKAGLKTELDQLTLSMKDILPAIKALLEAEQKREPDPKKKESLFKLLLRIGLLLGLAAVVEGGKQVKQETAGQTR